ncbi:MAG: COX15/CtaA family protein [Verrucomicrobiales bacterium]
MRPKSIQHWAFAALVSLIILIFIGAIVRVTGAGLGCPDWPTCWGKIIPPTSVEQIDFSQIDLAKFQKKAERLGLDPATVTRESLPAEFNVRHTWTEYLNRLFALPITLTTLILMILGLRSRELRPAIRRCCVLAFVLVLANAALGALVVLSALHTGIITVHLLLALLLTFVLVYIHRATAENPAPITGAPRVAVAFLLLLVITEGLIGSQIRELTDELQLAHQGEARTDWIHEIEHTAVYLIHRSFSWLIFFTTCWLFWKSRAHGTVPRLVMTTVAALMIMGVILSQIGIIALVQVLHVGLAAILSALVFHWWLAAPRRAA